MEEFDLKSIHRAGSAHGNADALSRIPCSKASCFCHDISGAEESQLCRAALVGGPADELGVGFGFSLDEIAGSSEKTDPEIKYIWTWWRKGTAKPNWEDVAIALRVR